jgi:DNA-binding transcriptional LysR family regulator
MYINLELYRIFYITAKLGSISKAAKELFTSQPAISQSIKQLEEKLGGQLFYRNHKGVSLTTEGEVLYHYIEQGYVLMQTAERKYLELKEMHAGQLRISVCSEVCKHVLLDAISKYNQMYPNIRLQIKDESSYDIARQLELGEIDIGILNLHNMNESNLDILKTIRIQDSFVTGEKYRYLCTNPISLHNLVEKYPIIMLQKGGNTRAYIDEYFHTHGINIVPQIELSNMELMIKFAEEGLGIACVVKDYVQVELQRGQLHEIVIEEKIESRNLGMAIKKGMPISTATSKFLDIFHTA